MNKLIILPVLILLFFILTILYIPMAPNANTTAVVKRVIDGDTFELEDGTRVRLPGINAPEKNEKCFAEATDFLKENTEGKEVVLEKDVMDKDYFGRLLRYVYVDEQFVNEIMVKEGFAKAEIVEPNVKYSEKMANAEKFAMKEEGCLWK